MWDSVMPSRMPFWKALPSSVKPSTLSGDSRGKVKPRGFSVKKNSYSVVSSPSSLKVRARKGTFGICGVLSSTASSIAASITSGRASSAPEDCSFLSGFAVLTLSLGFPWPRSQKSATTRQTRMARSTIIGTESKGAGSFGGQWEQTAPPSAASATQPRPSASLRKFCPSDTFSSATRNTSPVASDPLSKASPDGPLKIGSFAPGLPASKSHSAALMGLQIVPMWLRTGIQPFSPSGRRKSVMPSPTSCFSAAKIWPRTRVTGGSSGGASSSGLDRSLKALSGWSCSESS
mmetsp:Transcript_39343/g.116611  ORF Transcript_39343/g.116611 Transcript_39343/m.116611 type:complete len:290 (+) Transcript_39343:671-1540(+)